MDGCFSESVGAGVSAEARPLTCPYCESTAVLRPAKDIYGYDCDYGPLWTCAKFPSCDAYVGCHPGTETPLGRLADGPLRFAKVHAHKAFDPLWRAKMAKTGCSKGDARRAAYAWLAGQLGITAAECHIGMMDKEMCWRVEAICSPFTKPRAKSMSLA